MKFKKSLPLWSGALLLAASLHSNARADVYWQHNATISALGEPLLSAQIFNAWSGDNHKLTLKIDASGLADFGVSMAGQATKSEITFIERLGDDKIIGLLPAEKTFIEEPYSTLKSRFRLNLWKGLDDSLATDEMPELTREQRQRLGRELRASIGFLTKPMVKNYFRALPNQRTINGLPSRGFRLTSLINIDPKTKAGTWLSASAEWWIAEKRPEDAEIFSFTRRANDLKKAGGPLTQSMWANETYAILWQAAPRELHQAFATLVGEAGADDYGFQGTPMQMFVTVSPPPAQKAMFGDLRAKVELVKRETSSPTREAGVTPDTFQTPTENWKRQPIEPFLKLAQNAIDQSRRSLEKAMSGEK